MQQQDTLGFRKNWWLRWKQDTLCSLAPSSQESSSFRPWTSTTGAGDSSLAAGKQRLAPFWVFHHRLIDSDRLGIFHRLPICVTPCRRTDKRTSQKLSMDQKCFLSHFYRGSQASFPWDVWESVGASRRGSKSDNKSTVVGLLDMFRRT